MTTLKPTRLEPSLRSLVLAVLAVCIGLAAMHGGEPLPSPDRVRPWLLLVAAGLSSGFLAGLLGIGGALITIPVFYAVLPMLGVATAQLPAAVIGSSLLTMVPTTVAAARRQARHGVLDATWIRRLAPTMAVGAVVGAAVASEVRGPVLGWAFALHSLYYGSRLALDRRDDGGATTRGLTRRMSQLPTWLAGSTMSGVVAALGMGGGSVVAPFLRHRGVALRSAVATASALNLCVAVGGSASFLAATLTRPSGSGVHYGAAMLTGALAVLAAPAGVALAHRLPMAWFRGGIGLVNVVAGAVLATQLLGR